MNALTAVLEANVGSVDAIGKQHGQEQLGWIRAQFIDDEEFAATFFDNMLTYVPTKDLIKKIQ